MSAMSSERKYRILEKLAEKRSRDLPLIRSDAFDPQGAELVDRRPSLAGILHHRFGNVEMGDQGPSWRRELLTRIPGLSLTSERPVDLRQPATYGANYSLGDDTSIGLRYPFGGTPSATFQTMLGDGTLKANLMGKPVAPGQGMYRGALNYSIPLAVPNLTDAELSLNAEAGGQVGSGASLMPEDTGVNLTFGGRF